MSIVGAALWGPQTQCFEGGRYSPMKEEVEPSDMRTRDYWPAAGAQQPLEATVPAMGPAQAKGEPHRLSRR